MLGEGGNGGDKEKQREPADPQHNASLPIKLHAELNLARDVDLVADHAESRRTEVRIWDAEFHAVEQVEELRSKLQPVALEECCVLDDREIRIGLARGASIRRSARDISIMKRLIDSECIRVEPFIQPALRRPTGTLVGIAHQVRACCRINADTATDHQRDPISGCKNRIHLPSANNLFYTRLFNP